MLLLKKTKARRQLEAFIPEEPLLAFLPPGNFAEKRVLKRSDKEVIGKRQVHAQTCIVRRHIYIWQEIIYGFESF